MKNSKTYEIIKENFDIRCCNMVFAYILDKGWSNIEKIEDEDITVLEGNALMTEDFVKALVKTSRQICKECSIDDLVQLVKDQWV